MSDEIDESTWTEIASRRERERDPAGVPATLLHRHLQVAGVLEDVSRNGARFRTTDLSFALAAGNWVTLRFRCFRHATREEVQAIARVVWQRVFNDGAVHQRMLGLEFGEPIDMRRVTFTR